MWVVWKMNSDKTSINHITSECPEYCLRKETQADELTKKRSVLLTSSQGASQVPPVGAAWVESLATSQEHRCYLSAVVLPSLPMKTDCWMWRLWANPSTGDSISAAMETEPGRQLVCAWPPHLNTIFQREWFHEATAGYHFKKGEKTKATATQNLKCEQLELEYWMNIYQKYTQQVGERLLA